MYRPQGWFECIADPTQVNLLMSFNTLDAEVDHQDMLLIRIFKQVKNPLTFTSEEAGKGLATVEKDEKVI